MIFLSLRMPYVKRKIPSFRACKHQYISSFTLFPTQHTDNKYQRLKNNNHQNGRYQISTITIGIIIQGGTHHIDRLCLNHRLYIILR